MWTAAAAAVTEMLGGGLNCDTQRLFVYCGQLNALEAFCWIMWYVSVLYHPRFTQGMQDPGYLHDRCRAHPGHPGCSTRRRVQGFACGVSAPDLSLWCECLAHNHLLCYEHWGICMLYRLVLVEVRGWWSYVSMMYCSLPADYPTLSLHIVA